MLSLMIDSSRRGLAGRLEESQGRLTQHDFQTSQLSSDPLLIG